MHNFPIKLDLSNFFCDERRCSLVLVDVSWENVKDLQDHIQKLFNLKNISLLTSEGCYVPPKESIKVIKSTESLKAFQLDPTGNSNEELSHPTETSKKRKNRSVETENELISSTPNLPKRSKCKSITRNEVTYVEPASIRDGTNGVGSEDQSNLGTELLMQDDQRASYISSVDNNKSAATAATESSISNQSNRTTRNLSSFNKQSVSNNHILYKDDEDEENVPPNGTTVEKSLQLEHVEPEVEFRSQLMELDMNSVRVFRLSRKHKDIQIIEEIVIPAKAPAAEPKMDETQLEPSVETSIAVVTPIKADLEHTTMTPKSLPQLSLEISQQEQESANKMQAKELTQSLLDSDSDDDVMVLDDTNVDDSDSDVQAVPLKDTSLDVIKDMLQNAAPLENLPNVGETIIFKLPKVKGAKPPIAFTENIAGTCSYVNRRTKSITIAVIAYSDKFADVLQQYSSRLDDTTDAAPILNVNFRDLIQAKVIVTSVD
ncbi:PREDICTED: coilin [Drosophila arizonae]|uniref:Coilin n=1 Tax=Drosophila arizonae TaxID=7263 RepID=A0ABM1PFF1_DROAR|nr:PREDICTED: coilin [Drosophila arizonae]